MASFSSSTSTNGRKYDVFISFRGADTRLGFSGYLAYALREKGIKTFFDDGELQKGEVINSALENAIKESRIALVVFSENYASSKFCLEELSEIMECRKEKGTLVWPIFYKIDPADVRHQRGSYAEAFEKHEGRYASLIIRKWRLALQEAAHISGSHYDCQTYEHKFINDIIHEIIQPISEKAKVLNGPHEDLENHLQTIAKLRSDIQFFGSLKDLKNRDVVINHANNLLAKAISKVEDEFKRLLSSYRDAGSNVLEESLQKHGVEKLNKDKVQRLQRENLEVKIGNIASCQVDLVKDGGHIYFIKFLDSMEACPEHRAMAAFVLAVILDGHRRGQEACIEAGLIHVCLKHLQGSSPNDSQTKPLFLKWLCLCLGKLWEDFPEAQRIGLQEDAPSIYAPLLSEPQQEVRAAAVFALGTLLNVGFGSCRGVGGDVECDDDGKFRAEVSVVKSLLSVALDGSPLVRAEVAVALARFVLGHNKHLKSIAAPGFRSSPAVVPLQVQELNPTLNLPCPSSCLSLSPLMNGQNGLQQLLERCSCWRGSQSASPYWKPQSQTNSLRNLSPSLANIIGSGGGYPRLHQHTPHGSILSSQIGPVLRVGNVRDGRVSSSSPLTNSGVMHGSPLSDVSSHHSDSGILNDGFSNEVLNHTGPRPLENALYSQCVLAMCDLAKDPSPSIANLGRRVLSIIGIGQVVAKPSKSTGVRSSESAASPSLAGLACSSSWFDMNGGHLPLTFRTPPVNPPRPSYITGMRRVCSLEFRPHVMSSPDSGLADPLLGSGGTSGNLDNSFLPQSTIYNWSCGHFSKSLLNAADDSEEVLGRREEREKFALEHIAKCQHSAVSRLSNPIAKWDIKGTQTALLQPFSPIVIAADENECFRIWNHEKATLLNSFDNHDFPDKGISKLCLVNELDDSLLLAASSDGNIRIWKDYSLKGKQKLVTAFSSIHGHKPGVRCRNAVVDWQQQSGYLYASGEISSIMLWDLDKEQLLNHIPSSSYCSISALAASQVHGGQFAAGFLDGSVRLYDVRTPQMLVCRLRPHKQRVEKVVGIGFQPGLDPGKIVSASLAGDIQFLDIRNYSSAYLSIHAHRGSLTALAVHRHAPIIACGSAKQLIKVFSLEGDQLGTIRNYPTLLAPKIGAVSCLAFHPYEVLLAAGAADAFVSMYADDHTSRIGGTLENEQKIIQILVDYVE